MDTFSSLTSDSSPQLGVSASLRRIQTAAPHRLIPFFQVFQSYLGNPDRSLYLVVKLDGLRPNYLYAQQAASHRRIKNSLHLRPANCAQQLTGLNVQMPGVLAVEDSKADAFVGGDAFRPHH